MILKYSNLFYLELRVAPEHRGIDIKSIPKQDREKYYIQKNVPIRLSFTFERKRLEQFTGYRIDRNKWDSDKMRVRRNCFNSQGISAQIINAHLDEIQSSLGEIYFKAKSNGINVTVEYMRQELKKALGIEKVKRFSVQEGFGKYIDFKKTDYNENNTSISEGYIKQLNSTRNHLKKFKENLDFSDLDDKFFEDFKRYYFEKREEKDKNGEVKLISNSPNSFASTVKRLKSFLDYSFDQGWLKTAAYKEWEAHEKYINKPVFLDWSELIHFYEAKLQSPSQEKARDLFVFQSMIGARYDDLKSLDKTSIVEGKNSKGEKYFAMKYIQGKTDTPVEIPLNLMAIDIINKYKNPGGNLLPFISNQKCNEYLKQAAKKAGLKRIVENINSNGEVEKVPICDLISTHMARRNFVGNHLNEFGTEEVIVKSMTGHGKDSKSFSRYYDISLKTKLKAIEKMNEGGK